MAEAMELDLTLNQPNKEPIKNRAPPSQKSLPPKLQDNIPEQYLIESYYKGDTLGSDVLKQKYLAPWEQHPYQLWNRQATALASVEKTKSAEKVKQILFYEDLNLYLAGVLCTGQEERTSPQL